MVEIDEPGSVVIEDLNESDGLVIGVEKFDVAMRNMKTRSNQQIDRFEC